MATMAKKSWHAWRRVLPPPLHGRLLQTWLSAALSTSPQLSSARPCFPQSELPGQTLLHILPFFSFSAEVWRNNLVIGFKTPKPMNWRKFRPWWQVAPCKVNSLVPFCRPQVKWEKKSLRKEVDQSLLHKSWKVTCSRSVDRRCGLQSSKRPTSGREEDMSCVFGYSFHSLPFDCNFEPDTIQQW